ncbi:MAG: hypothetical protein H7243_06740 [Sphingomonadaceae bacterium]|nr:hypothetical protein [Sphingomonadaceae bacterium]
MERFLIEFHEIAPDEKSAFAGRLKHITRQGFPPGVGMGRGNPARYDANQFFQMVAITELAQLGVRPARAIKLLSKAWPHLRGAVLQVWASVDAADRGVTLKVLPIFWNVPAEAQRHRTRPDRPYSPDADDVMRAMTANEAQMLLTDHSGYDIRRFAFIAAHQVIADAFQHLRTGSFLGPHIRIAAFVHTMIAAPVVDANDVSLDQPAKVS